MRQAGRWSVTLAFGLAACGQGTPEAKDGPLSPLPADVTTAEGVINADSILGHIRVLSSDAFEGRAPGTAGEDSTVAYLTARFKALGLAPGNPDGSYVQSVDMVAFTSHPDVTITAGGKAMHLKFPDDYVAVSRRAAPEVKIENSEIVFVGYGVEAPEYQWDDYKGMDVTGKTIVMLVNDPAVVDATDTTRLDSKVFRGDAMTYYGRWTYKYEIGSTRKAAAVLLIHETGPAGYPFSVVRDSWSRENVGIKAADGNASRVSMESWITLEKAKELFKAAGANFDSLHAAARTREFKPVALKASLSANIKIDSRDIKSQNVLARIEGTDPTLKDEYLVYTAHWDHKGRDTTRKGDQIFNGALDNASGVAGMLEIARAFKALPTAPSRSVLFIAVTAEESGLLGAKYYAENPLYPLEKTLANINMDGMNQWGRTEDIVVIGTGNTTLEDRLGTLAGAKQRTLSPDPEPGKGFFYRSDHFEFAKKGVPSIFFDNGTKYIGKPPEYAKERRDEYTDKDYHNVSDEIKPNWDLSGAVEDFRLFFELGAQVVSDRTWPDWKEGTEFKALREKMLGPKKP